MPSDILNKHCDKLQMALTHAVLAIINGSSLFSELTMLATLIQPKTTTIKNSLLIKEKTKFLRVKESMPELPNLKCVHKQNKKYINKFL